MTSIGSLQTRDLTTDDLDAAFDVRSRSFGPLDPTMRDWWNDIQQESITEGRTIGVFDGSRLLAHARVRSYQQFWGGRAMPMGGVAGVVVAPEARGRGVGSQLMTGLARRSRDLGDLVSALYPATIPLYRALGWEVAGAQYRITLSADALRTLGGKDVPLRAATEADVEPFLVSLHSRYASQRANGPKLPTRAEAKEHLTGDSMMSYVGDGGGHVVFEWRKGDLAVSYLSADTPEVARALWSVVGSGSSVARKVLAYVAPDDPIHLLVAEEAAKEVQVTRWMFRVLDMPKAVAARGFSPAAAGSVTLQMEDPLLPDNSGSWALSLAGGAGELVAVPPTDSGLRLGPNGFAALYAGAPLHVLRAAGLASAGDPAGDELLDTAFAGRPAYLLEYF